MKNTKLLKDMANLLQKFKRSGVLSFSLEMFVIMKKVF